ncbi:MAG: carbon-nitrogen hydrolase family protein [Candidatus Brocadiae bacterium]|nr:carbon-nitrogen hydrolase family protein [Candidatus Brocadiia bacterium]
MFPAPGGKPSPLLKIGVPALEDNLTYRLAMAQMRTEWGDVERNLAHAGELIAEGARQHCSVVVLPECLDVGWTHPDVAKLAQPVPGPGSEALAEAARRHALWVVAGLTERDGDRVYNTAVLLSPEGQVALKHRKINVLDIAQPYYAIGDRLGVTQTPLGTIGVDICADNFVDSLVFAHSLARMGARAILSPCAWAVDADHDNRNDPYGGFWKESYTTVARLYDIPVVGVSNVGWIRGGPWEGRKCIGCSLAVARGGQVITMGPYGEDAEALIPIELEVSPMPVKGTEISGWLRQRESGGS